MSKAYNEYLKSEYWKSVTAAVKARAGYRCQLCNSQHDLQAYHRTYDNRGKELEHLDDLTCLCRRCHAVFHGVLVLQPIAEPKAARRHKGERHEVSYDHEADMPAGDSIILTKELINRLRTKRGAFTNATIEPLSVLRPLVSGWAGRLAGKVVTREVYWQCLLGREVYV